MAKLINSFLFYNKNTMEKLEQLFHDKDDLDIANTVIYELEYGFWMGETIAYKGNRINIAVFLVDLRSKLSGIRGELKANAIGEGLGEYGDAYRLKYVPDRLDDAEEMFQKKVLRVCRSLVEHNYLQTIENMPQIGISQERLPFICKNCYTLTDEGEKMAEEIKRVR